MRARAHPACSRVFARATVRCAGPAGLLLAVSRLARAGSCGPGVPPRTLFAFSSSCARGYLQLCQAPRLRGVRPVAGSRCSRRAAPAVGSPAICAWLCAGCGVSCVDFCVARPSMDHTQAAQLFSTSAGGVGAAF